MKPAHHLVELTSCIGKKPFDSYDLARAIVDRSRRGPNGARRAAYRCPTCDKWHIGRRSETSKAKRTIRRERIEREDELLDEFENCD